MNELGETPRSQQKMKPVVSERPRGGSSRVGSVALKPVEPKYPMSMLTNMNEHDENNPPPELPVYKYPTRMLTSMEQYDPNDLTKKPNK